jgi:hypothetical protein
MTAQWWSAHSRVSARAGEGLHGRHRHRNRLQPPHSGARSVSAGGKANETRVSLERCCASDFVQPIHARGR